MTIEIRRVAFAAELFDPLLRDAEATGAAFLSRLRDEWQSGTMRFEGPGEVLLGAFLDGALVAVGGVSADPYAPAAGLGRVRHLYVLRACRRQGVARRLMTALLERAQPWFTDLRLRTQSLEAARLYEGLGFEPSPRSGETHRLRFQLSSVSRP